MSQLRNVPVRLIDDGPNVRTNLKLGRNLIPSIRRHGVLQPITVRRSGSRYVVQIGFRRLTAARELGLETIPAIVEDEPRDDLILRQVAENADRASMNPLDVARALQAHLDAHPGMSKGELARALGKVGASGSVWVANKLALLRLETPLRDRVESGEISEGQAIAARQRLSDGRGRPRIVALPAEASRSRSVSVKFGQIHHAAAGGGSADVSIDRDAGSVEVVVRLGERGLFLSMTAAEARLFGRRVMQAGDALAALGAA